LTQRALGISQQSNRMFFFSILSLWTISITLSMSNPSNDIIQLCQIKIMSTIKFKKKSKIKFKCYQLSNNHDVIVFNASKQIKGC
jgi:hypothetical protein